MKRTLLRLVPGLLLLLTLVALPGRAQNQSQSQNQKAPANLTDQQRQGRQILAQACSVCHLPAGPGAKTYGPALNKTTLPDDDEAIRQTINEGNTRMPGFQYFLQPAQVDAVIAYLRTVPAPARAATPAPQKSEVD